MTKCLFIFPNAPLASNFSGGASRYLTSFQALHLLGEEHHVWRILSRDLAGKVAAREAGEEDYFARQRAQAVDWVDFVYPPRTGLPLPV